MLWIIIRNIWIIKHHKRKSESNFEYAFFYLGIINFCLHFEWRMPFAMNSLWSKNFVVTLIGSTISNFIICHTIIWRVQTFINPTIKHKLFLHVSYHFYHHVIIVIIFMLNLGLDISQASVVSEASLAWYNPIQVHFLQIQIESKSYNIACLKKEPNSNQIEFSLIWLVNHPTQMT